MPARSALVTLAISLLLALPATDARAQQIDPSWPEWLKDGMQKESRPRKGKTIEIPDGSFSSHLVGKPSDPQEIDNGWYFVTDIKSESPLECYAFTTSMDLARLTDILAETNISAVSDNYGEIDNRSIYYTDAGNIGEMPYLALEWVYTAGEPGAAVFGYTKIRAAARGDIALACTHNEMGHRETFEKAFVKFVESATYEPISPAPYYEEIALISLGDDPQGTVIVSYTLDEFGDTRIYISEASLTPVDSSTLSVSDATSISYSTPNGEMINAYESSVENGENALDLSLQRNDDDDWTVSGTMQQKQIEMTIGGDVTPMTELGQMAVARELFASDDPDAEIGIDVWVPSIDPTQFINARMLRDDTDVPGQATLELGPIAYSGRFDDYGNMSDATIAMGPVTVNIKRIWSRGELPK